MRRDPGSFRDPAGHVFLDGGRIYRVITEAGKSEYERVRDSGLLAELAEKGWVVDSYETEHRGGLPERAAYVVEHPKLPFISYPYEWSFYGLRDAALLQLDIHLASLERGITLNDASAYNVQFIGSDPIFIDTLSFREYRQDEPWIGHRQFCEHYLNPLLLRSVLGIPHNAWFRGDMDGIRVEHLARLLPLKSRFSLSLLQHVFLQAYFQRRAARARPTAAPPKPVRLPASMYKKLLLDMRTIVSRLHPAQGETVWAGYAESHSYQTDEVRAKAQFIADFCRAVSPKILWDVGCNTGDYSVVALSNGAERVIGFDFDVGALDRAYRRARGIA